ncbi:GNAT family N-acetyltransferase [Devosia lacusdianchii]|uniref:GNAT family N-acetyltransferase n=1 Tax=Devosia lacusdianchii TaxID=2917991 RepID=UPI0023DC2316|nr:GNAT family N-acetyltransferase [Devosia sp. JXJ CY 41]
MLLEQLNRSHIDAIVRCDGGKGWKNDRASWEQTAQEVEAGGRIVMVAPSGEAVCGYGSLLWHPDYPPFRAAGIPEIHDIATARAFRRQGVATKLISAFERIAAERGCAAVGLGVGLYADYGRHNASMWR